MSMSLGLDFPGLVAHWTENGMALQPATSRALEGYRDNLRLFGRLADVMRASGPFGRRRSWSRRPGTKVSARPPVPYTIGVAPPAASEGFVAVGALRRDVGRRPRRGGLLQRGATVAAPGVDILSASGRGLHRDERHEHGCSACRRGRSAVGGEPAGLHGPHRSRPAIRACHRQQPPTAGSRPDRCRRRARSRAARGDRGGAMARPTIGAPMSDDKVVGDVRRIFGDVGVPSPSGCGRAASPRPCNRWPGEARPDRRGDAPRARTRRREGDRRARQARRRSRAATSMLTSASGWRRSSCSKAAPRSSSRKATSSTAARVVAADRPSRSASAR